MKLIFMARKVSAAPQDPSYTLNVLPPNLTVLTIVETFQNIPIDNNLTNEPPTLAVSTAVSAQ